MMKKILALLVVLSMAFCFVACGPTEDPTPENPENPGNAACTSHVDNDGDGICDTAGCGATVNNGGGNVTAITPEAAAAYVNAIWSAVENAKTVTATINITSAQAQSDIVNNETGDVMFEAYENEMNVQMQLTLAMTETGLNLKLIGDAIMDDGEDVDAQKMEAYIVDGVAYSRTMYDGEWGVWNVEPIEIPEEANGMISQITAIITELLPQDFEVTPEMITEVKAAAASAITAVMTVNSDGSFGAKLDAKPVIDGVIEFITAIEADDTIGEVINSVLAMVDPEMTIEALLDGVGAYGAITVGELYTELNNALTAETGMSINDIKNAVLAEEAIVALLIENGVADADTLEAIAAADIETMIADYTEMTIDDLVYMIFAAQPSEPEAEVNPVSEDEAPEGEVDTTGTLAAMMAEVKAMLSMTVGDAMGGQYDAVMDIIKSIKIGDMYEYLTIKIGSDLSIEKIEIGEKVDITVTAPTTEYDKIELDDGSYDVIEIPCTVTATMKLETVFTITSVSNAETVITAPEVEEEVA